MRLVFAGTPQPAVPALKALIADPAHDVVAVLTRPDAPFGRKRVLRPSPVKEVALAHGIEVLTPDNLRDDAARKRLAELEPDCIPVVAYGNLVPQDLLDLPKHGWVNLHFSLLPAWRGAAPVQAAIAAGDDVTGASTFRIDEGLDTGPVLGTVTEPISVTDNADDLLTRLAYSGADLLCATMSGLQAGTVRAQAQSEDGVSHAAKIHPADAEIDWSLPAHIIDRRVRAHTPAPGAWTMLDGQRFKVGQLARVVDDLQQSLAPGEIAVDGKRVVVGAGSNTVVELVRAQPFGKKMMNAIDWARGANPTGKVLG